MGRLAPRWYLVSLGGLLAIMSPGIRYFWAHHAFERTAGAATFACAAAYCFLRLRWPHGPVTSRADRAIRIAEGLLVTAGLALVLRHLVLVQALSTAVLIGTSLTAAVILGILEVGVWAAMTLRCWRHTRRVGRTLLRAGQAALLIAVFNGLVYPVLGYAVLFYPPNAETCAALHEPAHIDRLTPQRLVDEASSPYRMVYVEDRDLLVVAFKMMGHHEFPPWNNPSANRLVVIPGATSERPGEPVILPLEGNGMAENLAYNAAWDEIILTRSGDDLDTSTIDLISLKGFPELKVVTRLPFERDPDDIMVHRGGDRFTVFRTDGKMVTFDRPSLKEVKRQIAVHLMLDHLWHEPRTSRAWGSTIGQQVFVIDVESGRTRRVNILFAGGDITGAPRLGKVYVADNLLGAVTMVDMASLETTRVSMPASMRPVEVDEGRGLVMAGELLSGALHLLDARTLAPLTAPTTHLGPYLRYFEYVPSKQLLFSGSKCGVLRTDIRPLLAPPS